VQSETSRASDWMASPLIDDPYACLPPEKNGRSKGCAARAFPSTPGQVVVAAKGPAQQNHDGTPDVRDGASWVGPVVVSAPGPTAEGLQLRSLRRRTCEVRPRRRESNTPASFSEPPALPAPNDQSDRMTQVGGAAFSSPRQPVTCTSLAGQAGARELRRGPDRLGFTPGTAALSASPQIYSPRAGSGRTPA
jgi:hypothetical protein